MTSNSSYALTLDRCDTTRRGVAMLLVIMSLAIASTLTFSYLVSRDNSAIIGQNVTAAVQARWTADAGIELAAAILETDANWREHHNDGAITTNLPLGTGHVTIDIRDLESDDIPNESTTHVRLTATATVGNISQSASAIASVTDAGDGSVDVDLSEFVIFSSEEIDLGDHSTLTRWSSSPLASLGRRIKLGTRSSNAMSVQVGHNAAAIDATLFFAQGASGSLLYSQQSQPIAKASTKDKIPMPPSPNPGALAPTEDEGATNASITSFWSRQEPPSRMLSLEMKRFSRGKLLSGTYTVADNAHLRAGANLLIKGDVNLIIFGKLRMQLSAIELAPDASLRIFVGRGATVHNSYIGQRRFNNIFNVNGSAQWINPDRIQIFALPDAQLGEPWRVTGLSVIKASVYAPGALFEMNGFSALYGRIAARRVKLRNHASVFYDHSLDQECGYTTSTSPLFDDFGHIRPDFCSLASIDDLPMTDPSLESDAESSSNPEEASPATPRPNEVDYELIVYGTQVTTWEEAP
ncbi:MAG: hypothetical protein P8J86_07330 [Phycisphaerales bacterium]|nr:hypothetical protein [Phycisphaerales bacterium]